MKMSSTNTWPQLTYVLLMTWYWSFGTFLVNKYLFDYKLHGVRFGVLAAAVFISAYPIFGWGRNDSWRFGKLSLSKWTLLGAGAGILATLVDLFVTGIVSHFS